jgi:hypothetical protein
MPYDPVYEAAMLKHREMPPEIRPPNPLTDWLVCRSVALVVKTLRADGTLPRSYRTPHLVWAPSRDSARGKALAGTCFQAPGFPTLIVLYEDIAGKAFDALFTGLHELRHSFADKSADSERVCDAFAWKCMAPCLRNATNALRREHGLPEYDHPIGTPLDLTNPVHRWMEHEGTKRF